MFSLETLKAKLIALAAYTFFLMAFTWHCHSIYDQAGQVGKQNTQIAATEKATQQGNTLFGGASSKITDLNSQAGLIADKWSIDHAKETPSDCQLPASTRQLLRETLAAARSASARGD